MKLHFNPDTLKLAYTPGTGKIQVAVVDAGDCFYCGGTPPATITVTFSGLADCVCIDGLYKATGVAAEVNKAFALDLDINSGWCRWAKEVEVSQLMEIGNLYCTPPLMEICTYDKLYIGAWLSSTRRIYIEVYYGGIWCGVPASPMSGGLLAFQGYSTAFPAETLCTDLDGNCNNAATGCGRLYYTALTGCNAGVGAWYHAPCTGGSAAFVF